MAGDENNGNGRISRLEERVEAIVTRFEDKQDAGFARLEKQLDDALREIRAELQLSIAAIRRDMSHDIENVETNVKKNTADIGTLFGFRSTIFSIAKYTAWLLGMGLTLSLGLLYAKVI